MLKRRIFSQREALKRRRTCDLEARSSSVAGCKSKQLHECSNFSLRKKEKQASDSTLFRGHTGKDEKSGRKPDGNVTLLPVLLWAVTLLSVIQEVMSHFHCSGPMLHQLFHTWKPGTWTKQATWSTCVQPYKPLSSVKNKESTSFCTPEAFFQLCFCVTRPHPTLRNQYRNR